MNVGYRPGTPRPARSHGSGTQESDQNVTWERPHPALWLRARRAHSRASKNNLFPGTALAYLMGTDAIHRLWRNLAGRRASSSAPSTIACSRTARSRWLSRRRPCARSRRASRARPGHGSGSSSFGVATRAAGCRSPWEPGSGRSCLASGTVLRCGPAAGPRGDSNDRTGKGRLCTLETIPTRTRR